MLRVDVHEVAPSLMTLGKAWGFKRAAAKTPRIDLQDVAMPARVLQVAPFKIVDLLLNVTKVLLDLLLSMQKGRY